MEYDFEFNMQKRKGNPIIKGVVVLCILSTTAAAGYGYVLDKKNGKIINKNVYVNDIDLSGKVPSEAKQLLQDNYSKPLLSKKLSIIANNKEYVLNCANLNIKYNIDDTVSAAFNYGKDGNILDRYKNRKSTDRKDIKLSYTYDTKYLTSFIDIIEKEVNKEPVNAKITVTDGNINITPGVEGIALERDPLMHDIIAAIEDNSPDKASIITALSVNVKPKISAEDLSPVNTLISSFSTSFTTSTANRINNIELATKAINGTILMPGETFSFNEMVGERTKARGYKEAHVIVNNKIEDGLGGGICQVSSTLYNAMLSANLKATERRNHSIPSTYIPKGLDATVDWGNIDLKFENTLPTPIYIEGYTKDKQVFFQIYSSDTHPNITYKMTSEVIATVQPSVKYVNNSNLAEGSTRVLNSGTVGYKVKAYRETYQDNKLVNTELLSSDYYAAADKVIEKGTKK